jgi:hypothetical protein
MLLSLTFPQPSAPNIFPSLSGAATCDTFHPRQHRQIRVMPLCHIGQHSKGAEEDLYHQKDLDLVQRHLIKIL